MRFQDEYYAPLALFQGLILPTVIAGMFWGDWMGGFLIAGTLPPRPPELCSCYCIEADAGPSHCR